LKIKFLIYRTPLKESIRENASKELESTYTPSNNSSSLKTLAVSNELPTRPNIPHDISVREESSTTFSNPEIKTEEITDKVNISRQETETWILSKLTSYSIGDDSFFNFNYTFRNGYLVCEYYSRDKPLRKYCRVSIPIDDFSRVEESQYHNYLEMFTNGKTMKRYFFENNKEIIDDTMPIPFNFDKETNLTMRLQKAFLHLKTFYKKSSHKEAF
jgi:hypothetical protein